MTNSDRLVLGNMLYTELAAVQKLSRQHGGRLCNDYLDRQKCGQSLCIDSQGSGLGHSECATTHDVACWNDVLAERWLVETSQNWKTGLDNKKAGSCHAIQASV